MVKMQNKMSSFTADPVLAEFSDLLEPGLLLDALSALSLR